MKQIAIRLSGVVLILLIWEISARTGLVPPTYVPPPSAVVVAGWQLIMSNSFLAQLGATCGRAVSGLVIATVIGLCVAIAGIRYPVIERMLAPLVGMLRALPPPAIVPLSIFALGIGIQLFMFIIAFAAVWPIYINAVNALRASEPQQMLAGRSLGYTGWETLLKIRLPGAVPEIITGIRLGAGIALLATIASEMLAGQSGLGFLLYDAAFTLRTKEMFAIMVIIGVIGFLFNALVRFLSRYIVGWHLTMTAMGNPT